VPYWSSVFAMTQLMLTAVGDDREGLVSALSRVVEAHGGSWLDSQLARLAGKFAGIVLVEVPADNVTAFTAESAQLQGELGWKIDAIVAGGGGAQGREVHVQLVGLDRPGMVRQITAALAEHHVSIRAFRSWTHQAPHSGGLLFEAEAVLALPVGLAIEDVRAALEPIADELMVDLELAEPS
jgi:glycine cleavage system regulatory protein